MLRAITFTALLFAGILICTADAAAQAPTRITFARGTTSTVVSGTMRGANSKRTYVIKVRAGQTMKIEQLGNGSRPLTILLTDANGDDAGDMDLSCHNRYNISPTVAGDYTLDVSECGKADPWRGTFRFRVTVR